MEKLTKYYKGKKGEATLVFHNASHLIQTVSLLVCAYYNYATAVHAHVSPFEVKLRVASSLVLAFTGCYLLMCHLAQKEAK